MAMNRPTSPRWVQAVKEFVRPYYLRWFYFPLSPQKRPPAFVRWRTFPAYDFKTSLAAQSQCADVVFLPMADWHGLMQRSQQLALALAGLGHRCFYLNPHLGREMPRPYPLSPHRLIRVLAPNIFEIHIHLPAEPVFHHRLLRPAEAKAVADTILWALDSADSRSQILISSIPLWTGVCERIRQMRGATVIYDCHDLLEGFPNVVKDLVLAEPAAMEMADTVLFSAEWLAREHAKRSPVVAPKSVLVRNGANPDAFGSHSVQQSLVGRPVTIGYIGALSFWFDSEMVKVAAESHPEWKFVLVGPQTDADLECLRACSNVELIGEVAYDTLPIWMARFDVAMIPFRIQPLTLATNPIKLYEYFASGLPVVSSALPEVQRYADLVYVASDANQFVRQLEVAATEVNVELRSKRRAVAEQESWRARAETLRNCLVRSTASV